MNYWPSGQGSIKTHWPNIFSIMIMFCQVPTDSLGQWGFQRLFTLIQRQNS